MSEREQIQMGNCPTCGDFCQVIAGDGDSVTYRPVDLESRLRAENERLKTLADEWETDARHIDRSYTNDDRMYARADQLRYCADQIRAALNPTDTEAGR